MKKGLYLAHEGCSKLKRKTNILIRRANSLHSSKEAANSAAKILILVIRSAS